MKPLERHRCLVLDIELLQPLRAARAGIADIARRFAVGMKSGHAAAVGLLEFVQIAIRTHPQLSVQVEKIDLVTHTVFPCCMVAILYA